ncbi:MAG: leucine-rich repeat protein [Oscillospiraceae bacterium]|jgi:pectin methylesterase-like acyl-CoA thioesterase|nr:leucine-rich repeat protein [Oscillospiraceae bacterium]
MKMRERRLISILICLAMIFSFLALIPINQGNFLLNIQAAEVNPASDFDYIVGADEEYTTVQAAVNAARDAVGNTGEAKAIYVKNGDYEGRVIVTQPNLTIIGESRDGVRIFASNNTALAGAAGGDMYERNVVKIAATATGFYASNFTIENTFKYNNGSNQQADALAVLAEQCVFIDVKLVSFLNTLLVDGKDNYFKNCYITGNLDFIYGGGIALFEDCELVARYTSDKADGSYVAGKQVSTLPYGFVFYNCNLTAEDGIADNAYRLARPWGADAYVLFYDCAMGAHINAAEPYQDMSVNSYENARFYECENTGAGAAINANRPQMSAVNANQVMAELYFEIDFFGIDRLDFTIVEGVITDYDGTATDLIIPSVIQGQNVVGIGKEAFKGNTDITSVVIPDSVTSIGKYAFSECTALESVEIPDSVETIGVQAFWNTGLKSVVIPAGVTSMGSAFDGCKELTSVVISQGVGSISDGAFYGCSALEEIVIPDSVTSISSQAFAECTALADVTISENLETIESYAFYNCTSLKEIEFPNGLTSIGSGAFENSGLTEINIPDTVTSIGANAFANCALSKAIIYSASITFGDDFFGTDIFSNVADGFKIYGYAVSDVDTYAETKRFEFVPFTAEDLEYTIVNGVITDYNDTATDLTIPSMIQGQNIVGIGIGAFYHKDTLRTVEIPDGVKTIGELAFANCTNLTEVTFGENSKLETIEYEAFYSTKISKITIPEGVTSIGDRAFYSTSFSKVVFLNSGETTFGANVIPTSHQLTIYGYAGSAVETYVKDTVNDLTVTFVPFGANDSDYTIVDGVITGYSGTATDLVIPDTIQGQEIVGIGNAAFYNNDDIISVEIPKSVLVIESNAFYSCENLEEVTFAAGSQLEQINSTAFYETGLTKITIPASVKTIYAYAFNYCANLEEVTFGENSKLETIGSGAFDNSGLTSIAIPDNVTSIGFSAFYECEKLTTVTFGKNSELETISSQAFYNSGLTSIAIPKEVTSIGTNAFYNCANLEEVTFGKDSELTTIGVGAFSATTALTAIYIPEGVTSIANSTFLNSGLKEVYIPNSVTDIAGNSFQSCTALEKIVINNPTAIIQPNAFFGVKTDLAVVYGYSGSTAETFANENGYEFEPFGANDSDYTIVNGVITKYNGTAENLTIPSMIQGQNIVGIGDWAFWNKRTLKTVKIPEGVTSIGESAFIDSGLTEIAIPDSVTAIGKNAFRACLNLTSVTFGENSQLETIGENAFADAQFTKITIPKKLVI